MNFTWLGIVEAFALAASLSLDAFAASFAYGSAKIKIPFHSTLIISAVCSAMLSVTLFLGAAIRPYVDPRVTKYISFGILTLIGAIKLFSELIKLWLKKHTDKTVNFKMFDFKFMLKIISNETAADVDGNQVLSPLEALALAAALSIDGLAVGFSAGIGSVNPIILIAFSLIIGIGFICLGAFLGNKIAKKVKINLSWLSGVILIVIAVTKLI